MIKPVDLDELFLRIGALLRRSKIASSHRLEIGNFVMDADERTATWNESEISLTAREFNLLYKLLSYPKRTFTRTQLMDEFWDVDTQTSARTADVYMTKLRTKLADCDCFEIQTVHGLGYKEVIKVLEMVSRFLSFFLLIALVISCCLILFTTTLQNTIGREFTQEEITAAAKATMANVILISIY